MWSPGNAVPVATAVVEPAKHMMKGSYVLRGLSIAHGIERTCRQYKVLKVAIEEPAFFGGRKGFASAARGDLVKLTFGYAVAIKTFADMGAVITPVPVRDWKGTATKRAIIARIERRIDRTYKSHIADAVGIGLHSFYPEIWSK